MLETFSIPHVEMEQIDELTYRMLFDREDHTVGEVIRRLVAAADVRDIFIEEESIEQIVKRVYTGRSVPEFERSRA